MRLVESRWNRTVPCVPLEMLKLVSMTGDMCAPFMTKLPEDRPVSSSIGRTTSGMNLLAIASWLMSLPRTAMSSALGSNSAAGDTFILPDPCSWPPSTSSAWIACSVITFVAVSNENTAPASWNGTRW